MGSERNEIENKCDQAHCIQIPFEIENYITHLTGGIIISRFVCKI